MTQGIFPQAAAWPQKAPQALEVTFLPSLVLVNSGSWEMTIIIVPHYSLCTSLVLGKLDPPWLERTSWKCVCLSAPLLVLWVQILWRLSPEEDATWSSGALRQCPWVGVHGRRGFLAVGVYWLPLGARP